MKQHFWLILLVFCLQVKTSYGQLSQLDSLYKEGFNRTAAGDVSGATPFLLEAIKLADAENNTKRQCQIYYLLAKLGIISENNDATEKALQLGEKYCIACKDTFVLARLCLTKGILEAKKGQFEAAVVSFNKGYEICMTQNDSVGAFNILAKVGNVLEMQGKYLEAQAYYKRFYEFTQKRNRDDRYITANIYLCGNYLYLQDYKKAKFHNDEVKHYAHALNQNYEYAQSLRYDAMIHHEMGRNAEAYDKLFHFAAYYQDTLMGAEHLRQSEDLKAKYETEKKEKQIALQEAELAQEKFRSWVLLGGLAATLVVGAFFFILARKLRKRNDEKEFLIKEIHHRVKNNLQILSSLLHLQSRQITDGRALEAVREGQNRVEAMGLIHQKLYMGDNVAKVEMKEYLEQFGQNMLDSFGIEDGRVNIVYDLQPMYLDVDTAIPLSLIINELTTNSLKYAFPDNRSGIITIALWKNEQNHLCLKVSDNGVGRLNAQKDEKSTAFGTNLVQMLSKKLKGTSEALPQESGYAMRIVFEKWT